VKGSFDFSLHREFRDSYEKNSDDLQSSHKYVVDLRQTSYMDSSALGMLLLLKDYADSKKSRITILCGSEVREILAIANFDNIFTIEGR
jgi:anti-anti-sigma factor